MKKLVQMKVDKEYYSDNTRVNNSFIGWFLQSPLYAYNRLNGIVDGETTSYMGKGSMIHMWLLQKEDFWKEYEFIDFTVPNSAKKKQFAELVSKLNNVGKTPIDLYREVYATDKLTEDEIAKRANELVKETADYVDYLLKLSKKQIITSYDYNSLKKIADNVKQHKLANYLLNEVSDASVASEFHVNWNYTVPGTDIIIPAKALIDRIRIDFENKLIQLVDIKNTENNSSFEHSIDKFDYYRQLAWYWHAIEAYMGEFTDYNFNDFKKETYFVTIQWKDSYVRVFEVDWETMEQKQTELKQILTNIHWHLYNDLWAHSREYYEGNGAEKLRTAA